MINFQKAKWIWHNSFRGVNVYVNFEDEFTLDTVPTKCGIKISCDRNYALYINGSFVDSGQYSDYEDLKFYDELDITPYVKPGNNTLLAVVYYQGTSCSTYRRGEPISDAASPMHGMDKNGPTAVILSVSKPDYTKVSCGTVVNQKYSPEMFKNDELRAKLLAMIKTYMSRGGQEIQINSVSREMLIDAMHHPEKYQNLVVRVSGFSAHYVTLDRRVQEDILKRTEHGG